MLRAHFLNVGHGDCTVLEHPSGRLTVIDINNSSVLGEKTAKDIYASLGRQNYYLDQLVRASAGLPTQPKDMVVAAGYDIALTDPVDWLIDNGHKYIFRFIVTHPDMDHITGLSKMDQSEIYVENFWDLPHEFDKDDSDFEKARFNKEDWNVYKKMRASTGGPKALNPLRNHSRDFWAHDSIAILSPDENLINVAGDNDSPNILSYVLLVTHGTTKIYLCGDATTDHTLPDIIEHYGEDFFRKKDGETIVLKAPHHGRDSGFHEDFVKLLEPDHVIVSVGKKPSTDASVKYRQYSPNVVSTRWKGNISVEAYDDGTVYPNYEYER